MVKDLLLFVNLFFLKIISSRFCNKRQALKNSAKKFKSNQINDNDDNESTSSSLIDKINYSKSEQDVILT